MNAEERTHMAIHCTREILRKALDSPFTLVEMTARSMNVYHIEDQVTVILEYLEKTKPKKSPGDLGIDTIEERSCGTCIHGGKDYWTGMCSLDTKNPVKKDRHDVCGAWHRK